MKNEKINKGKIKNRKKNVAETHGRNKYYSRGDT
jgi:hypothetical protein